VPIDREWIKQFYTECGREASLAHEVHNNTNTWGVTLVTGVVAVTFISAVRFEDTGVALKYPTAALWFVMIGAWIITCRFFVRSCIALSNTYRWNTLAIAATQILSLPADSPHSPLFERNFAKKVKAYYYDWRSPIAQRKLVWTTLKLMYLWFFLIFFGLLMWGFVELDRDKSWLVGLLLFLIPTAAEAYWFVTWRGFKHEKLELEKEPEITLLWQSPGSTGATGESSSGETEGETEMANGDSSLKKLEYDKALEIRYREVDLLFQRFNFFMAGMSFIVAAFAAIVATDQTGDLASASRAIAVLGVVLSSVFTAMNFFAGHTIREYDDHVLKTERELTLANPPFETIMNNASDYPWMLGKIFRWLAQYFRASHTWVIPLLFIGFWAFMCVEFWCC